MSILKKLFGGGSENITAQMTKKTDQELIDMVSDTQGWFPKTIEAAKAELKKRNVALPTKRASVAEPPPPAPVAQPESPKPVTSKIHVPKPSRIYVAGNMFSPENDDIIQGVRGFLHRHDNLDRESCIPPGIEMEGLFAMGADAAQFCEVALSTIFDDGKHPGAYYLDAVLLSPNGKQMMVVVLWEGEQAIAASQQVPGGTQR